MLKKILTLTLMLTLVSAIAFAKEISFTYDKTNNLKGKIVYPDKIVIPIDVQKKAKKTGKMPKILPPIIVYLPESDTYYADEPMESFLKNGYAVATIEHSENFPQNIIDSKAAIRFIKMHSDKFDVDIEKLGVWGGNTAAFVAVAPYHPEFEDYKAVKEGESSRVSAALLVAPCVEDVPTRFNEVLNYVDASSSYAFIVNSVMDRTSNIKKAEKFAKKLENAIGFNNVVFVKTDTASGEKYVFNENITKKVIDFFDKKFKLK